MLANVWRMFAASLGACWASLEHPCQWGECSPQGEVHWHLSKPCPVYHRKSNRNVAMNVESEHKPEILGRGT